MMFLSSHKKKAAGDRGRELFFLSEVCVERTVYHICGTS